MLVRECRDSPLHVAYGMTKTASDIIKLLIVDDHRLYSDGLSAMLSPEYGIEVLGQVYDSRLARERIATCNPHVILMDYIMPHLSGVDLIKLLLRESPDLKILVLSIHNEERLIESFRSIGARGYMCKTASIGEVVMAARKVYEGEYYFPDTQTSNAVPNVNRSEKPKLSAREEEVVQLMKTGLKTREIAQRLKVSDYTVEMCQKNIRLKAGVKIDADFTRFINEW